MGPKMANFRSPPKMNVDSLDWSPGLPGPDTCMQH